MALDLNSLYEDLTNPMELIKNFNTDLEFVDWLKLGTKEDLEFTLKSFENYELYEHCNLIKEQIEWLNRMID